MLSPYAKRIVVATVTGCLLGIFCIIGVSSRMGFSGNELFLFAMWYNRVLMGLTIGIAGSIEICKGGLNTVFRGAVFGLLFSAAIFVSSGFADEMAFFAGIVYGVIIDYAATKAVKR